MDTDFKKDSMYLTVLLVFVAAVFDSANAAFDCGPSCRCDEDYDKPAPMNVRAICTGNNLRLIPKFPSNLANRIYVLGLARNLISHLDSSDLDSFPNLKVLDLRDQLTCVDAVGSFPPELQIYSEACKPRNVSKPVESPGNDFKLLKKLKKQILGMAPLIPILQSPRFNRLNMTQGGNGTSHNGTNANSTITTPAPLLTRDTARQVMSILERFRQALEEGGHTTLALIIYAIITTIAIIVVLGILCCRCKKCRTVQKSHPITGLHLSGLSRSLSTSTDSSFPPPPPPDHPAIMNMTDSASTESSEVELFNKAQCCPRLPAQKQHEA